MSPTYLRQSASSWSLLRHVSSCCIYCLVCSAPVRCKRALPLQSHPFNPERTSILILRMPRSRPPCNQQQIVPPGAVAAVAKASKPPTQAAATCQRRQLPRLTVTIASGWNTGSRAYHQGWCVHSDSRLDNGCTQQQRICMHVLQGSVYSDWLLVKALGQHR
jgi:hypothetical protein